MGNELHELTRPPGARRKRKRIGRGPGSGTGQNAGRGSKGQHKRRSVRKPFEGGQNPIHRRVPKRGFTNDERIEVHGVNVALLEKSFNAGETVSFEILRDRGLIPKRARVLKLLGTGDLAKKLTIRIHRASASARAKVEAAGGSLHLLEGEGGVE